MSQPDLKQTKTIEVHGFECTLEKRVCSGGCGKEFWVLPDSKAKHARSDCIYICNVPINEIPEHIMRRFDSEFAVPMDAANFNVDDERKRYAKQILFNRSNMISEDVKKNKKEEKKERIKKEAIVKNTSQLHKWNRAVDRVKKVIKNKSKISRYREIVAVIAKSVVTSKKNFSIKCFSTQVGLDRKTLQTWLYVKCEVIDYLPEYDGHFLAARRTREEIRKGATELKISDIYAKEKQKCLEKKLEMKIQNQNQPKKKRQPKLKSISHCKSDDKSNGSMTTDESGKVKTYRLKIRLKSVS